MLTEEQIKELEPLTRHLKYGKLLIDAIEVWKIYNPVTGDFGCMPDESGKFIKFEFSQGCCLLGAACINKIDDLKSRPNLILNEFNIQLTEFWNLSDGFDGTNKFNDDNEAWVFGSNIRKIVKPLTN